MASDNKTNSSSVQNTTPYPYQDSQQRLNRYIVNKMLFNGDHFEAFSKRVDNPVYGRDYSKIRYIVANFPGLISKVSADMLFSETPIITFSDDNPDAETNAKWLENLVFENRLASTFYESALSNSYKGDAVFKVRNGALFDQTESVIIEQVMPDYYFPVLDPSNVSAPPKSIELSFKLKIGDQQYVRKEIHEAGLIRNELWKLDENKLTVQVDLGLLGDDAPEPVVETGISRILVTHVPNWSDGTSHFGIDDYHDLITLFYAINNRISKVDNVLDKHSDPILGVPEGILDENGEVNRRYLDVVELPADGSGAKPEYIVWDAKIDAAMDEIDKMMEMLYMFSETSPAVFGMDKNGQAESGRALKFRLLRTIAKIRRKRLYYDIAIKEILYTAQIVAKELNIDAMGVHFKGEPELLNVEWKDGLPKDMLEAAQVESLRAAAGNQTIKDAIKNLDELDEDDAAEKAEEIEEEKQANMPKINVPVSGNVGASSKQDVEEEGTSKNQKGEVKNEDTQEE